MGSVASRGRAITKEEYKEIEEMVARGITRQSIAQWLGMSVPTFYRTLEKNERLKSALERGRDKDFQFMMNVTREKAIDGSFQHLNGYMRVVHAINMGGDGDVNRNGGGVSITVNLNMLQNAIENAQNAQNGKIDDFIEGEYSDSE